VSVSESKSELLKVINKYEKEPESDDIAKFNGRFIQFMKVSAEELDKGLQEGKYRISYLGEFYIDYGRWGPTYYPDIPEYYSWKAKCEREGYFELESMCFAIPKERVVGLFQDEWLRRDDHVLIFDYYIVEEVSDQDSDDDNVEDYEEGEEEEDYEYDDDNDYGDEEEW